MIIILNRAFNIFYRLRTLMIKNYFTAEENFFLLLPMNFTTDLELNDLNDDTPLIIPKAQSVCITSTVFFDHTHPDLITLLSPPLNTPRTES